MASAALGKVYLVPTFLDEENLAPLPAYLLPAIADCGSFFVENERSARRYLKQLWKEMVIDDYQWHTIHKAEEEVRDTFRKTLQRGMNVAIISEAGCPAIADPGALLVEAAHQLGARVIPLSGPSAILLALMGSGMNGQKFRFNGYLPIDNAEKIKAIKLLEQDSAKQNCTEMFIETPYRNNQLIEILCKTLQPGTRLCIAAGLTSSQEFIKTRTVEEWRKQIPAVNKLPAMFLVYARGLQ